MNERQREQQRDMLRHFPTLLARWAGAAARMTELTRSHPSLAIELRRQGSAGFLRVACIDPLFIHGPVDWSDAHLTVELSSDDAVFVVRDVGADVSITTSKVEVKEFVHSPSTT
jgi:hypothetical protein